MTQNAFWKSLVFAILVFGTNASLMGQESLYECDVARNDNAPVYAVGRTRRAPDETPTLTLFVTVQPSVLNVDAMRGLGRALNRRFCKDRTIEAIIADDERVATKWDPFHLPEFYAAAIRGSYFLDRDSRKEYIAFSTARGRGFDEFLNLGPTDEQSPNRTYTHAYQNVKYGYSVVLPTSFVGTSNVPKDREGGINISLSSGTNRYIWVGATENSFRFSSLRLATIFQQAWVQAEGATIIGFTQDPHYRLRNSKGTRLTVRYKIDGSDEIMVKDFVLALKRKKEDVGTLYRLEMGSTEKAYREDKKIFDQIVRSWRRY